MTKLTRRNKRKLTLAFHNMSGVMLNNMDHKRRSVGRTFTWYF
jgi:hypothetical protein